MSNLVLPLILGILTVLPPFLLIAWFQQKDAAKKRLLAAGMLLTAPVGFFVVLYVQTQLNTPDHGMAWIQLYLPLAFFALHFLFGLLHLGKKEASNP